MYPPDQPDEQQTNAAGDHDPRFLAGSGRVTLAALRERVELQFSAETAARPDILQAMDEPARRDLIRELVDYVLTMEAITLSRADRLSVLDTLYKDLFSLGPLDVYLSEPTVTEIRIEGADRIYVRHGSDELAPVDAHFDDQVHLERIIERTVVTAGAELNEREPLLEIGVMFAGRPARLTVALPPVSPVMHAALRLHPKDPLTLADLVEAERLDDSAARLLGAILKGGHGLMIVGDAGAGKTTLLQTLLSEAPGSNTLVERAAELKIPDGFTRLAVIPPTTSQDPVTFPDQILKALKTLQGQSQHERSWLILDEVRFDESVAMWEALTADGAPRCLWAFRGATDPLRLRTAFGMSVRRARQGIDQAQIHSALLDRLPFVALLARREGKLKLLGISEWQRTGSDESEITLRPIWPPGGVSPIHPVDWTPASD